MTTRPIVRRKVKPRQIGFDRPLDGTKLINNNDHPLISLSLPFIADVIGECGGNSCRNPYNRLIRTEPGRPANPIPRYLFPRNPTDELPGTSPPIALPDRLVRYALALRSRALTEQGSRECSWEKRFRQRIGGECWSGDHHLGSGELGGVGSQLIRDRVGVVHNVELTILPWGVWVE